MITNQLHNQSCSTSIILFFFVHRIGFKPMSWFPTQIKSLLHKSLCQRCIYCSAPTRSRTVLYGLKGRCNPPVSRHLPIYDGSISYPVCTHLTTIGLGYRLYLFTFYALNLFHISISLFFFYYLISIKVSFSFAFLIHLISNKAFSTG